MARDCGFYGIDDGRVNIGMHLKELPRDDSLSRAEFYTERGWDKIRVFTNGALKRVIRRRAMPTLSDEELARL